MAEVNLAEKIEHYKNEYKRFLNTLEMVDSPKIKAAFTAGMAIALQDHGYTFSQTAIIGLSLME